MIPRSLLVLFALLLSGCTTAKFVAFSGQQPDWPTALGALVEDIDGIPVYHGLPPKPYIVLGEVSLAQRHVLAPSVLNKAATVAKEHGADGVIVLEEGRDLLNVTSTGGGTAQAQHNSTTSYYGRTANTQGTGTANWQSYGVATPVYGGTARVVLFKFKP